MKEKIVVAVIALLVVIGAIFTAMAIKGEEESLQKQEERIVVSEKVTDECTEEYVCSMMIYREALKHELEEPKQWEIREINGIMNDSIDGWNAITSTHRFAKYGIQRGWKRVTNDDGMYPVPDGVKIPFDN